MKPNYRTLKRKLLMMEPGVLTEAEIRELLFALSVLKAESARFDKLRGAA